ncbi:PREDICTED: uncharacterized protein LOC108791014 [Nanorana parkeri]|uniref:uncharacterized protein LOC108791014 n=1 Tax=Nanorana parkeri TaxID=125878 RepID=UPI000854E00C|nr:PREDICTED: uncharacterized protein LOC108791014 [Nanorana parkeri]
MEMHDIDPWHLGPSQHSVDDGGLLLSIPALPPTICNDAATTLKIKICNVGCSVGTFLHTPVLTRRAFAFVRCGETKKALQDAETAIVLDSLNPDVYCVRALVWCTMQRKEEAIKDLNYSLRLNPSHVCSLILRGNIQKYIALEKNGCMTLNNDHEKALQINYSSLRFVHIKDFNSLHISEFYHSFLWSLNVPHTVASLPCVCPSVHDASVHIKRISSAPGSERSPEGYREASSKHGTLWHFVVIKQERKHHSLVDRMAQPPS